MQDGEGTFALLILGTRSLPGRPSAEETGTTEGALGWLGHPTGTTVPSVPGRSCFPVVVLAEVHTLSHSVNSSLGQSKRRDIVHSSRRTWSPPSAALRGLAERPVVPGTTFRLPCLGEQGHRGWGCRTATASSWPLCTLTCAPSCSETTPGQEGEKRMTFRYEIEANKWHDSASVDR